MRPTPPARPGSSHRIHRFSLVEIAALLVIPAALGQPRVTAVVNGASFQAPVAPGSFAAIAGQGLSTTTATASTAAWPLELAGVSITVNGQRAPIYYVSPSQINFQVPLATATGQASLVVRLNSTNSPAFPFQVAGAAPGILVFGTNQAVATHPDGSVITPDNPVNPNGYAVIYLTGVGPVDHPVADGAPTPLSPLAQASRPFSLTIGDREATVAFLGLTPGFVGLAQANVAIPSGLPPGNYPVVLTVGGTRSSSSAPVLAVDNPPAIQSLSRDAGVPGTRIHLAGVTLPAGTEVKSVLVQFDDGGVVPAPPLNSSSGELSFYVPYIPDSETALGYRTGLCNIVFYNGRTTSNALPFRIDPLPAPVDAVGRFKTIIQVLAGSSSRSLTAQKAIPDYSALAEAIEPLSQARTGTLLAMADQVAASGRATLPMDLAGPLQAGAPAVEVTLRDIENLVAVLDQAEPEDSTARNSKVPNRQAGSGGPCLFDLPGYQYCTILAQTPEVYSDAMANGPLFRMIEHAFTVGPQIYNGRRVLCTINRSAISPFVIANSLLQYLNDRRLTCKLQPTKPVSLKASPLPDPIPAGSFESTGNRGTLITMRLEPFWTPEFTVDEVLQTLYLNTFQDAIPFPDQCALDLRADLARVAAEMFNRSRERLLEALRKIATEKFREVPLYKCDLTDVQPSFAGSSLIRRRADKDDDATTRWGVEGIRTGLARLDIHPVSDHFLPDLFTTSPGTICPGPVPRPFVRSLSGDFRPLEPCVNVNVAGQVKGLEVVSSQVFSYTSDTGPLDITYYNPPQAVTGLAPFERTDRSQDAESSVKIEQIGEDRWRMTQTVSGAPDSKQEITDTWNQVRLNLINRPGPKKIQVQVRSNVSGTCHGMHAQMMGQTSEFREDEGNNGCAPSWDLSVYSPPGPSAAAVTTLDIGVFILGGRGTSFGSGKGSVTTEIEILDDSPQ